MPSASGQATAALPTDAARRAFARADAYPVGLVRGNVRRRAPAQRGQPLSRPAAFVRGGGRVSRRAARAGSGPGVRVRRGHAGRVGVTSSASPGPSCCAWPGATRRRTPPATWPIPSTPSCTASTRATACAGRCSTTTTGAARSAAGCGLWWRSGSSTARGPPGGSIRCRNPARPGEPVRRARS